VKQAGQRRVNTGRNEECRVRRDHGQHGTLLRTVAVALALLGALTVGSCGTADPAPEDTPQPSQTPSTPAPTSTAPAAQGQEPPIQVKIAFINLLSPLALDANNPAAAQTFDQRLDIVIEELRAFNPDIVGFNEASWTKATGSAAEKLAKALKMELQYGRANPWFPGQTKEQSDEIVKLTGFEEGELILSRYPILRYERKALNPRTSETGEGRAGLHVVVRGPGGLGEIDVYITHLTGGDEKLRTAQTADFIAFIGTTRGNGPLVVLGDLNEQPGGAVQQAFLTAGLADVAATTADKPLLTCCREAVTGEQPPLQSRTDYIFTAGNWSLQTVGAFATLPRKRADGALVYASDHDGLKATFTLPPDLPQP